MAAAAAPCGVCKAAPSKYKCPKCVLRYCGVACYGEHKVECEASRAVAAAAVASSTAAAGSSSSSGGGGAGGSGGRAATAALAPLSDDAMEEEGLLPDATLARLTRDPELLTALRDPRLQRVLAAIDGARDRPEALKAAKRTEGKQFQEFLDRLLIALGVCERGAGGEVVFVG